MTLLAANPLAGLLPLLFLLACPLMMILMMRGHGRHGHGHGGHGSAGHGCCKDGDAAAASDQPRSRAGMSVEELERERDELDALIGERAEQDLLARR